MIDVSDVKPIVTDIELQDINDPDKGLKTFSQHDDDDTSTIGEGMFHPEAKKKSPMAKTLLKVFIAVTVVAVILIAIICLVIFAGPKITGTTTKAPATATPPVPTVIPGVVVGDVDIELSATLNGVTFIPAYNDQSSPEYMAFASNAETQVKIFNEIGVKRLRIRSIKCYHQ
ncbi:uncharacterized protein LOC105441285 [Strongylocentrotus purpuratus]|uniref:Uncharacterized protein n=1 Tax=Strongylocentrotus purpuratus TaxID=7668 RepID=A0A7M7NCJ2_STRPU|nr:uncharacterized protein LOC105441285 [Strongylocentrotus purpuratus]